jgi:hypothetical protein
MERGDDGADVGREIDYRRMLRMVILVRDRYQMCAGMVSRVGSSYGVREAKGHMGDVAEYIQCDV